MEAETLDVLRTQNRVLRKANKVLREANKVLHEYNDLLFKELCNDKAANLTVDVNPE